MPNEKEKKEEKKICVIVVVVLVILLICCLASRLYPTAGAVKQITTKEGESLAVSVSVKVELSTWHIDRYVLLINGTPVFVIKVYITINITATNVENFSATILIGFQHPNVGTKDLGVVVQDVPSEGVYSFLFSITARAFVYNVFGGYDPSWNNTQGNLIVDTTVDGWGKISRRVLEVDAQTSILFNLAYIKESIHIKAFTFSVATTVLILGITKKRKESQILNDPF